MFSVSTNGSGGIDGTDGYNFFGYDFSTLTPAVIDGINIGTNNDGNNPYDGFLLAGNHLYGTADTGGVFGFGTIFSVATNFSGRGFDSVASARRKI